MLKNKKINNYLLTDFGIGIEININFLHDFICYDIKIKTANLGY